ncbi:MAG: hypothetical protein LBS99_02790 [Clostridiales bacterium]|jgi:hypothetical protein|nr:hypothetical protein [Clostridiales bacterium]
MKRFLKRLLGAFVILLVIVIAGVLFVGWSAFSFSADKVTAADYSGIIADNITGDPRVVDIAMLGAHDAFSDKITPKNAVDPQDAADGILNNGAVRFLGSGMIFRLSKAQRSGAYDLLTRGVRYFDVRVTISEGEWYTVHGQLSDKLDGYLTETVKFLSENPGELIIFDMQHVKTGDKTFADLFAHIGSVEYEGLSLLDFVRFDPFTVPLGSLTYSEAVSGGAGVVILAKTGQYSGCAHYEYEEAIRSNWHEHNSSEVMLERITAEYDALCADPALDRNKFRVNQAQKTGLLTGEGIANTIFGWSLLDFAYNFNPELVANESFDAWLTVMPIFMVDYADSMKGGFNDKVIGRINAFNASLL